VSCNKFTVFSFFLDGPYVLEEFPKCAHLIHVYISYWHFVHTFFKVTPYDLTTMYSHKIPIHTHMFSNCNKIFPCESYSKINIFSNTGVFNQQLPLMQNVDSSSQQVLVMLVVSNTLSIFVKRILPALLFQRTDRTIVLKFFLFNNC
jgi:hypothetical protein